MIESLRNNQSFKNGDQIIQKGKKPIVFETQGYQNQLYTNGGIKTHNFYVFFICFICAFYVFSMYN